MMKGLSAKEIGASLFKSDKTINTFWYRAKKKLDVNNLFGVLRKWATQRMLDIPDMEEHIQYRAGYSQALADMLDPDLTIFTRKPK